MLQESVEKKQIDREIQELITSRQFSTALLDSLPYPAMVIRKDRTILMANKAAKEAGAGVGSFCWDSFGKRASMSKEDREYYEKNGTIPPSGIKCTFCGAKNALDCQEPIWEKVVADDVCYSAHWVPLTDSVYLHYAIKL